MPVRSRSPALNFPLRYKLRARTTSIGLAPFVAKLNQPRIAVAGSLRTAFIKFTPTVVNYPLSINLRSLPRVPGIEPKVQQNY